MISGNTHNSKYRFSARLHSWLLILLLSVSYPLFADLNDGLVGYWNFDDGEGELAADSSGHDNDGIINGAAWTEGVRGTALEFDGTDDWVDIGTLGDFGMRMGRSTVSLWLKTDYTAARSVPFKIIQPPGNHIDLVYAIECNRKLESCGAYPYTAGATMVYLRDADGKVLSQYIDTDIFDNQWHHLVWRIVDAPTNQIEIYIDGERQSALGNCANSPSLFNSFTNSIAVGASNNRGTLEDFFNGSIDEVRVYDRALTCAEITALADLAFSTADFNRDSRVDIADLKILAAEWLHTENLTADILPDCGDNITNLLDFSALLNHWLTDSD